ncbi:MAG: hydrogenase small subunit [Gammaproteobacteria bacterium SHHR-1]|uniref:hydrogenase small subunit n=1 Tax=Magnetovirga frankeli TaxID=947516 RepID=UPI001293DBDB|nr:hydrogenase small subunit [gamma proteobacterium SS-5]
MFDQPLSRRDFLKRIYAALVTVGASSFLSFEDLLAADAASPDDRLNVVWLHGTSCSGCSCSFLDIEYVSVPDILTRFTNMIFHPDISLATGDQVTGLLDRLHASDMPYLLVLEGGIPVGMPHACIMGGRPFVDWMKPLAAKASAVVAAGTCAALGGIPKMEGMITGSHTLAEFLRREGLEKPLVNLPGCPMKPEHLVYTLLHYIRVGRMPEMDASQRPLRFFEHSIHDRCVYYADFQEKYFAKKIGDPGCLLKLGCQGPVTHSDCMINGHNGNTNTCIRAGHPCIGCADEHFPRKVMLHSFDDKRFARKRRPF